MDVTVNMSVEEFQEFMAWKDDKAQYARELVKTRKAPEMIAASLRFAVEPVEGKEGRYKIVSQEHMADVMDMVEEYATKK